MANDTDTRALSGYKVRRRAASAQVLRSDQFTFTPEEILQSVRRWNALYGEPPAMVDWEPARARRLGAAWRADRFESGHWPSARMVRSHFKTFNAAIAAAGLPPRRAPMRLRANLADSAAVLEAVREWTRRYGDVPTMADWDPVRARLLTQDWRIARYYGDDWPSARSVANHFGSFSRAIAEAGLQPRPRASKRTADRERKAANRQTLAELQAQQLPCPGMHDLASSLRAVAAARTAADPVKLNVALLDLASSALAWAEVAGGEA